MFKSKRESGQTIVLIVVMIFGLAALSALVVDGGNAYLSRRNAQTAADAAALAAANEFCIKYTGSTSDLDAVSTYLQSVVDEYAVLQNKADSATVSYSPADSNYPKGKITVNTFIEKPTFFAKVIGIDTVDVSASAAVGCFLPAEANNLIPVAWTCNVSAVVSEGSPSIENCKIAQIPVSVFDYLENLNGWDWYKQNLLDEGDQTLVNSDLSTYAGSYMDNVGGKMVYMVMNDTDFDEETDCKELNKPDTEDGGDPPGEGFITCDFDGDGIVNLQGSERGWLCLYEGCAGASDLWDLMLSGYQGVIEMPQWFIAIDGVQNSTFDKANEILFRKSLVPVFNAVCPLPGSGLSGTTDVDLPSDCPEQYNAATDLILPSTGSNDYYRVPGIAVFVITCVSRGNAPNQYCPGKELSGLYDQPNTAKTATIEGYFVSGYVAGKKIATGGFDLGVYVLSLIE